MAQVQAKIRRGDAASSLLALGRHSTGWLFLLPTLFFFVGWQVYPIIRVLWISFTDYKFLKDEVVHWIWFQNYVDVLADPLFRLGLLRALYFTVLFVPPCILIPMVLAVMIDRVQNSFLATFYRIVLLIPAVIPGPLIFVLWKWLYDFSIGPINYVLVEYLHLFTKQTAPQWLGNPWLVMVAIAIMEVWWGLGYHTMFFLAGLAAIPRELFEAARVDGANEWNMFWRVTVPRLLPILLVLVVLRFGTAMAVIDEYLILGGFNRGLATYTWTVYMWDYAFQLGDWNQGYAAAAGWIGTVAMLIVVVIMFYVFRSRD